MSLYVYNPTSGPSLKELRMAPREKTFDHSVIGLIDNGKTNSDTVVQSIADRLKNRYKVKEVIVHKKLSFSHGIEDAEAIMLAKKCDFIISGVGD